MIRPVIARKISVPQITERITLRRPVFKKIWNSWNLFRFLVSKIGSTATSFMIYNQFTFTENTYKSST